MPKKRLSSASIGITLEIKRKPLRSFATSSLCEHAIEILITDDLVKELSPWDEWRNHSSTEAKGKGYQQEREVWVNNDLITSHVAKFRQHTYVPTKAIGRSGSKGASSPPSISYSSNYFHVLAEETEHEEEEEQEECLHITLAIRPQSPEEQWQEALSRDME
jgi:hypothetical protein